MLPEFVHNAPEVGISETSATAFIALLTATYA